MSRGLVAGVVTGEEAGDFMEAPHGDKMRGLKFGAGDLDPERGNDLPRNFSSCAGFSCRGGGDKAVQPPLCRTPGVAGKGTTGVERGTVARDDIPDGDFDKPGRGDVPTGGVPVVFGWLGPSNGLVGAGDLESGGEETKAPGLFCRPPSVDRSPLGRRAACCTFTLGGTFARGLARNAPVDERGPLGDAGERFRGKGVCGRTRVGECDGADGRVACWQLVNDGRDAWDPCCPPCKGGPWTGTRIIAMPHTRLRDQWNKSLS